MIIKICDQLAQLTL